METQKAIPTPPPRLIEQLNRGYHITVKILGLHEQFVGLVAQLSSVLWWTFDSTRFVPCCDEITSFLLFPFVMIFSVVSGTPNSTAPKSYLAYQALQSDAATPFPRSLI